MNNVYNHPIFMKNLSTLKDTSIDNRCAKCSDYMTQSTLTAVDFDAVKDEYIKPLKLNATPKSNDALFFDEKETLFFIEFKNGKIDGERQFELRKKIYDSVLIFTDIVDVGIKELRQNMEYILVYNEAANSNNKDVKLSDEEKKSHIQLSTSFDQIAKMVSGLGNNEYVRFGLRSFENYCFRRVHTYTKEEFDKFLSSLN